MYGIGIDVGSTYTKYCVMHDARQIVELFSERTPVRQREYFYGKSEELLGQYPGARMVSCGYGRENLPAVQKINELTALARGSDFANPEINTVLDIGGQDIKVIRQERGHLKEFFVNDRCAAGSGIFLSHILHLLEKDFSEIDLTGASEPEFRLSSVCAVFAQSEIVELLADNVSEELIVRAVLRQILTKAKVLLNKIGSKTVLLSGGMTQIKGFGEYAQSVWGGVDCFVGNFSNYLSAAGAALYALEGK